MQINKLIDIFLVLVFAALVGGCRHTTSSDSQPKEQSNESNTIGQHYSEWNLNDDSFKSQVIEDAAKTINDWWMGGKIETTIAIASPDLEFAFFIDEELYGKWHRIGAAMGSGNRLNACDLFSVTVARDTKEGADKTMVHSFSARIRAVNSYTLKLDGKDETFIAENVGRIGVSVEVQIESDGTRYGGSLLGFDHPDAEKDGYRILWGQMFGKSLESSKRVALVARPSQSKNKTD